VLRFAEAKAQYPFLTVHSIAFRIEKINGKCYVFNNKAGRLQNAE
jgi:hypothetical protein